jgi:hypothetical protein
MGLAQRVGTTDLERSNAKTSDLRFKVIAFVTFDLRLRAHGAAMDMVCLPCERCRSRKFRTARVRKDAHLRIHEMSMGGSLTSDLDDAAMWHG